MSQEECDLDFIFATTLDAVHHANLKMKDIQKESLENDESANDSNDETKQNFLTFKA